MSNTSKQPREQETDGVDHPDTHTGTTDSDDELRHALPTAAGVAPASVRVGGAAAGAGALTIAIAGAEL
jgi:hypothetical protein